VLVFDILDHKLQI